MNYYNEFDPYAAQWLRNLISAGAIPSGHVDQRSITEVKPEDLAGFVQCHFFAGIAGWSLALKLAGIDPSTPLWTGSCPCQPFSAAGKRKGTDDERHLWPVFRDLIAQCRPPIVLGEQVASSDGRNWLAAVRSDMEALAYAVGAADLCAAGVGAPHIRQRLYFVGLAESACQLHNGRGDTGQGGRDEYPDSSADGRLADPERPSPPDSFWSATDWLFCRDGKWRPVEPGTFPLAHGIPNRVGRLRAYGNAIVPQVAATFIRAALPERKTD